VNCSSEFGMKDDKYLLGCCSHLLVFGKQIRMVGAYGVGKSAFANLMIIYFTTTKGKDEIDG
jgi:hypothetical protein